MNPARSRPSSTSSRPPTRTAYRPPRRSGRRRGRPGGRCGARSLVDAGDHGRDGRRRRPARPALALARAGRPGDQRRARTASWSTTRRRRSTSRRTAGSPLSASPSACSPRCVAWLVLRRDRGPGLLLGVTLGGLAAFAGHLADRPAGRAQRLQDWHDSSQAGQTYAGATGPARLRGAAGGRVQAR